jgi:hypothetical protein
MTFSELLDQYLNLRDEHTYQASRERGDSLVRIDRINQMALLRANLDEIVTMNTEAAPIVPPVIKEVPTLTQAEAAMLYGDDGEFKTERRLVTAKKLAANITSKRKDGVTFSLSMGKSRSGTVTSLFNRDKTVRWLLRDARDCVELVIDGKLWGGVKCYGDIVVALRKTAFEKSDLDDKKAK